MMRTILLGAGLFAFAAPVLAQPQPVTLAGAPGRWTINGKTVLDEVLASRVRIIFETRREKRLHFTTAAGTPYAQVIDALGMARGAGVEQLVLLAQDGRTDDGLLVADLVPLSGLDTDLRLPVTDMSGSAPAPTDVEVTLRTGGAEPVGLAGASSASGIVLRADAGATYGDVLRALRQAKARGARSLGLAVQKPQGPGELKRRCEAGRARDCGSLGEMYLFGIGGAPKAEATGLDLVRKACNAADHESCETLARLLWSGETVKQDRGEATRLLTENCRARVDSSCRLLRNEGLPVPSAR
jgi:biopolymer transport protein ExbD